jgi:hyperosmotically inducible periplasmic protein
MNSRIATWSLMTPVLAAALLAGCSKTDTDNAQAKVEQKADEMKAGAAAAMDKAKAATEQATQDVKDATKSAVDTTKATVDDATITTSVKTSLAKDKDLSALAISVDTAAGAVSLKGTAPDAAAKDRATQLASAVKGVQSVDNQLTVKQ